MTMAGRRPYLLFTLLGLGFAFLYGPIVSLIVYSFNESRLVTVWSRFSLKWYGELARNHDMLAAAGLSLEIAAINATVALALGTMAAVALTRYGRFRGRAPLQVMVTAPLVMPEVITGLSALLLFVALEEVTGWPEGRGMGTIVFAHVTISMAYVTVVVRSRLMRMDRSLEEAALDLGARPAKVFFVITVPVIAPALAAGWLLAFTLSLDDLVVASFVSGPGATTLPMMVYSSARLGVSPQINALATIIVVLVAVGILASGWLARPKAESVRNGGSDGK